MWVSKGEKQSVIQEIQSEKAIFCDWWVKIIFTPYS
jgi:hypothetical protein